MSPLYISVIIPIYNLNPTLNNMVQAVVNQTYRALDIILVDDGSTDGSAALCDAWAEKDTRIRCIHQSNAGVSAARNAGMAAAEGDVILFADGDDYIEPTMCETMLKHLLDARADFCYCGFYNVYPDSATLQVPEAQTLHGNDIRKAMAYDLTFSTAIWNKLYRRHMLLDENGVFIPFPTDMRFGEDGMWLARVLKNAETAVSVPEALYYYLRHKESATAGLDFAKSPKHALPYTHCRRMMALEYEETEIRNILWRIYVGFARDVLLHAYGDSNTELTKEVLAMLKQDLLRFGFLGASTLKTMVYMLPVLLHLPRALARKLVNRPAPAPEGLIPPDRLPEGARI